MRVEREEEKNQRKKRYKTTNRGKMILDLRGVGGKYKEEGENTAGKSK
jgi:hypothetical protein